MILIIIIWVSIMMLITSLSYSCTAMLIDIHLWTKQGFYENLIYENMMEQAGLEKIE